MLGLLLEIYNMLISNGEVKTSPLLKQIEEVFDAHGLALYFDGELQEYSLFSVATSKRGVNA